MFGCHQLKVLCQKYNIIDFVLLLASVKLFYVNWPSFFLLVFFSVVVSFFSFLFYCTRIHFIGVPKNFEDARVRHLGWGVADPREHVSPVPVLTCQIRSFCVKPYKCNYRATENFASSRTAFQGHSRSVEPTRINQLPMTSCHCQ